jgi:hypothetical protein
MQSWAITDKHRLQACASTTVIEIPSLRASQGRSKHRTQNRSALTQRTYCMRGQSLLRIYCSAAFTELSDPKSECNRTKEHLAFQFFQTPLNPNQRTATQITCRSAAEFLLPQCKECSPKKHIALHLDNFGKIDGRPVSPLGRPRNAAQFLGPHRQPTLPLLRN